MEFDPLHLRQRKWRPGVFPEFRPECGLPGILAGTALEGKIESIYERLGKLEQEVSTLKAKVK